MNCIEIGRDVKKKKINPIMIFWYPNSDAMRLCRHQAWFSHYLSKPIYTPRRTSMQSLFTLALVQNPFVLCVPTVVASFHS